MRNIKVLLIALLGLSSSYIQAAGSDIKKINLSLLDKRGMLMRVLTDGRPIWIAYRTEEAIELIRKRPEPHYADDNPSLDPVYRSLNKDYFIVFGGCPNGPELPAYDPNEGFTCLSSCAKFDMAGRPLNGCAGNKPMDIPTYHFEGPNTIVIPIHQDGGT